jgi:hypothetical protein
MTPLKGGTTFITKKTWAERKKTEVTHYTKNLEKDRITLT